MQSSKDKIMNSRKKLGTSKVERLKEQVAKHNKHKNTKNMKELKIETPISILLYSVSLYVCHVVLMDLVVMVERVIYHGQVGL